MVIFQNNHARLEREQFNRHGGLLPTQRHAKDQLCHPFEGAMPAVNLQFFQHFPTAEGGCQPAQAENMVKVAVGE
jgi:hypothetical protein